MTESRTTLVQSREAAQGVNGVRDEMVSAFFCSARTSHWPLTFVRRAVGWLASLDVRLIPENFRR